MTPRPSSLSAASRTITPSRTVELESEPQPEQEQPVRQVIVEEAPIGEGAAFGAPDQPEEQLQQAAQEELEEEDEEVHERSRSEPPKTKVKPLRTSPTTRPLVLRPRVPAYPEIRVDQTGTWALNVWWGRKVV